MRSFCLVVLTLWFGSTIAFAQMSEHSTLILLMDRSGSMKVSDPRCVRADASRLLLQVLPQGDRVAVIEFGDTATPIGNQMDLVSTASVANIMKQLGSCAASDLHTDIVSALDAALAVIAAMSVENRAAYPPHVFLFTDGKYDPPDSHARPDPSLIDNRLEQLKELGVKLHTLGLGLAADRKLLDRMSRVTGGQAVFASTASDLFAGFFSVARLLSGRWLVGDRRLAAGDSEVVVPEWSSDWQALFVPDRPGISVGLNGGGPVAGDRGYTLLHGRATGPIRFSASGSGRLLVDASGSLSFAAVVPKVVAQDAFFPCSARLTSTVGAPLGSPAFLSAAAVGVTIAGKDTASTFPLYDDGRHDDGQSSDGIWAGRCRVAVSGNTKWEAKLAIFRSEPPAATGTVSVTNEPIAIRQRSVFGRLWEATSGSPTHLTLQNVTDMALDGHFVLDSFSQDVVVDAGSQRVVLANVPYADVTTKNLLPIFHLRNSDVHYRLQNVTAFGRLVFPGALACCVLLLGASFALPRRSAAGGTLAVRSLTEEDEEAFAAVGSITPSGTVQFGEPPPEPYRDPGRFVAKSGLWSRGVIFWPAAWMSPEFKIRVRKRRDGSYLLKRTVSWTTTHNGNRVSYNLQPRT